MRNLKKILALALALVMSMSLMATANAFTDDDSITDTYETAVTVLSGLQVFQGYDDGSFLPQGAITRAEVAAIIYRIVTGDVADTQVGIYADYNKFDDVASTSWYAGYVNFCANAEYIKGYDAKTFGPNDPVTGYQALAMILRALGYDKNGEFTGTNWQVQTAAVGENRGITKNVTAGTLGVAATREVVAEILFQAILVDTVNYTPAFGYQLNNTSLGYDTFKLEDITGVVVANEYADLYSGSPMDEGETELNVDGDSYTLAYATTVEDLGEARHAYVTGETVLAIADAGNTVWTNEGAEADISSNSKFESASGLEKGDAEEYINFGGDGDAYESDYRIEYTVSFNSAAAAEDFEDVTGVDVTALSGYTTANGYTKVIRAGAAIEDQDLDIIKGIFTVADDSDLTDGIQGAVYVGTRSNNNAEDVSDEMSYRAFYNEYINEVGDNAEVESADNGEWLKVVDNDGDGEADYVFLLEFAMSVINRISKDGEYTLADLDNHDEVEFTETKIDEGDIVTEDELAEGDVVIYTKIDGVYYVNLAEMVTETVDKKGINSKTETMTCDGTDYVQSHIGYTDDTNYLWDVTDALTEETYDLYLDHFGYVRLFIESEYNVFMLLTDGWYEDDNRNETFKAYYWDVEADEETEIDVSNDASDFIADHNPTGWNGDVETWGRLYGADVTYLQPYGWRNTYASNIAGYSESDDGYALRTVGASTSRVDYAVQAFDVDGLKDRYLEASDNTENDIQTTTGTQYYLVIRSHNNRTVNGWQIDDVITWTGYANAPDEAKLVDNTSVGYAVTHESDAGSYNVADVVVFETYAYDDHNTYFVYETNNWHSEYVWGLGYDEEGKIADDRISVDTNVEPAEIEFYEIYEDGVMAPITSNYADSNIYAGRVSTGWDVEDVDYIQIDDTAAGKLYITTANIYQVVIERDGDYNVEIMDRDDVNPGDAMILFTDDDENVEYAINAGPTMVPYVDLEDVIPAVMTLWDEIMADADAPTAYEAAMAQANAALVTPYDVAELNAAKAALEALYTVDADGNVVTDLTANEYRNVLNKIQEINVALAQAPADALAAAKTAAVAELESFAAPLSDEIAKDDVSYVGVTEKTWLEQYKDSSDTDATVQTVLDAEIAKINAAADEAAVTNAMLTGKINVWQEVMGAAVNNLVRLVGGADASSGTGKDFVGKYWNAAIDTAFDAAWDVFSAAPTAEAWADGSALTDLIDAYDTAFAAIQPEVYEVIGADVKAEVKTAIGNTVGLDSQPSWNDFVNYVETQIETASNVDNAVVTTSAPSDYAAGKIITVEYTFDYTVGGGVLSYSDSFSVTLVATTTPLTISFIMTRAAPRY